MREVRPVLSTLLLATAMALPAGAVEVTTTADVIADDGECSLREAVLAANGTPANDDCPAGSPVLIDGVTYTLIQLIGGATYTLAIPEASEDAAETGDLDVLAPTFVYSDTAGLPATIDGGGIDRVFDVFFEDFSITLVLIDVAVRNGVAGGSEPECLDGGGGLRIEAGATAVLSGVSVVGNEAAVCGGGILNLGTLIALPDVGIPDDPSPELSDTVVGAATNTAIAEAESRLRALAPRVRRSASSTGAPRLATAQSHLPAPAALLLENNVATFGGGLWTADQTVLIAATIDGNQATRGGGIFNADLLAEGGDVIVLHSTVSDNRAVQGPVDLTPIPGEGGGLYHEGEETILLNSTFSGNAALGAGGAIHHTGGRVTLVHATIFANGAATSGGIFVADGIEASELILLNSIVADNTGGDCLAAAPGEIISGGGNIDSDDSCDLDGPADQPGVDPLLGALADNGGPTRTHLPLAGSPAIDAVTNESEDEDQRFFPRPVDGDGDGVVASDVGAVEVSELSVLEIPTAGTLGFALLAALLAAAGLWTLRRPG